MNQNNQFYIHKDAIAVLSQIKTKLCVVVVSGPYRSGKSTLLNLLVNRTNRQNNQKHGFAVGGTTTAVTKGIWLWSTPAVHTDTNTNESITTIYLDSEGLGSTDTTSTFDTQIFSLSLLLCSLFILNTSGAINESALDQLDLVVHLTDKIHTSATQKTNNSTTNELAQHMPAFIWLLRDFVLQLVSKHDSTRAINSTQYLEESLESVQSNKQSTVDKNRIRSVIKSVFPIRDCMTFVRPVNDETQLQQLDKLPESQYRHEFISQVNQLKQRIIQLCKPKQINQQYINGNMFIQLAQQYCDSINSGAVMNINSAWNNVLQIQSRDALNTAVQYIQQHVTQLSNSDDIISDEQLNSALGQITTHAYKSIHDATMNNTTIEAELKDKLNLFITSSTNTLKQTNTLRSAEYNRKLIASIVKQSQLEQLIAQHRYDNINTILNDIHTQYKSQARNNTADSVYLEYTHNMYQSMISALLQHITKLNTDYHSLATKYDTELQQYKSNEQQYNKQIHQYELDKQKLQSTNESYIKNIKRYESQVDELQQQAHEYNTRYQALQEQLNTVQLSAAASDTALKYNVNQLHSSLSTLQQEYDKLQHTNKAQLQAIDQLQQQVDSTDQANQSQIQLLNKQLNDTRQQVTQKSIEHQQHTIESSKQYESQINELHQQIQQQTNEYNNKYNQLQNQLQQQMNNAKLQAQHNNTNEINDKQLKHANQQISTLQNENESLQHDIKDYELEQTKLLHEIKQLQRQISNIEQSHDNIDDDNDHNADMMPELETDHTTQQSSPQHTTTVKSRASTASTSYTTHELADAKRRSTGKFLAKEDPNKLTIAQLKSWLTANDIELPVKQQTKPYYVDLVYQNDSALETLFPREIKGKK